MSDYQPISCAAHSELELHIMHRQRLRLRVNEAGEVHEKSVLPVDIGAERGEEFLHVERRDGERLKVRLDAILHYEPE